MWTMPWALTLHTRMAESTTSLQTLSMDWFAPPRVSAHQQDLRPRPLLSMPTPQDEDTSWPRSTSLETTPHSLAPYPASNMELAALPAVTSTLNNNLCFPPLSAGKNNQQTVMLENQQTVTIDPHPVEMRDTELCLSVISTFTSHLTVTPEYFTSLHHYMITHYSRKIVITAHA